MNEYMDLAEADFESEVADMSLQDISNELVDGHSNCIVLSHIPVNTVGTIEINRGTRFDTDWSNIVTDVSKTLPNYAVVDESAIGKVILNYPTIGDKIYRVSYNSGYSYANMPINIKQLVRIMTLRHVFKNNFFSSQGSGNVQEVVDVEVYRRITGGGSPYKGLTDIDNVISDAKGKVLRKFRTFVV